MTDDDIQAKAEAEHAAWAESERLAEATAELRADNERLRALIKKREFIGPRPHGDGYGTGCLWCSGYVTDGSTPTHDDDCPAFMPNGDVR